jgi:DNA mismatch endonuclease (patch repair protein)
MQAVKQTNTAPEMRVRKFAHRLGLRFRLHAKDLPGKPDLVFPKWKVCIFVHGCFWHRHAGCRRSSTPFVNRELWIKKFTKNVDRDQRTSSVLQSLGWRVEVIWECETSPEALRERLWEIFVLK